jgi:hypothetical protein
MIRCLPIVLLAALSGCGNPCQDLCTDMADYATECGYTVTADDIQGCRDQYASANLTPESVAACSENSDPEAMREWWSCDDVAENFTNSVK